MKRLMRHLLFLAALLVAASMAQAAINPATAQKLLAGDGTADDIFGVSVSVSGDTVAAVPARRMCLSALWTALGASRPS